MIERAKHFYEFGQFRIDEGDRVLLREGQPVPLAPKVFDTLLALVKDHGHVFEKERLMKELWPDTFVEESNLTYNISQLRKALGDGERYIETIPRRGYRFTAPVQEGDEETAALIIEERSQSRTVIEEEVSENGKGRAAWKVAVAVLAILLCAGLLYVFRGRGHGVEVRSLAILPFRNVTADAQDEYLADGITDALITRLTSFKNLSVLSYSMVRRYRGSSQSAAEIGRQLGVDTVLEGAMRRSGGRLRLSVHLVNAATGFVVWADDHFETEVRELLDAQSQLTESVAVQLRGHLTPAERVQVTKSSTTNAEAYELMLRGKQLASRNPASHASGNHSDLELAVQLFKRAIALDPTFADAYAWLGYALHQQFKYAVGDRTALAAAVANTDKALSLDPNCLVAMLAKSFILFATGHEREGPALARRLLDSNPNDLDAVAAAAQAFFRAGMVNRAIPLYRKALAADPANREFRSQLARCFVYVREFQKGLDVVAPDLAEGKPQFIAIELLANLGRFDEAIRAMEITVKNEPNDFVAWQIGGTVLEIAGHPVRAREAWREGIRRSEAILAKVENFHPRVFQGLMYAYLGLREKALETDRRALEAYPNHPFVLYYSCMTRAILGDKEEAIETLKQAVDNGWMGIHYVDNDQRPGWELYNLRDNPRFQAVRAELARKVAELEKQY
jgi:DNA-binding winged helix-turn-helix (wHTH) protein/TolB-like protein/Flp pilus assembly protein TadD